MQVVCTQLSAVSVKKSENISRKSTNNMQLEIQTINPTNPKQLSIVILKKFVLLCASDLLTRVYFLLRTKGKPGHPFPFAPFPPQGKRVISNSKISLLLQTIKLGFVHFTLILIYSQILEFSYTFQMVQKSCEHSQSGGMNLKPILKEPFAKQKTNAQSIIKWLHRTTFDYIYQGLTIIATSHLSCFSGDGLKRVPWPLYNIRFNVLSAMFHQECFTAGNQFFSLGYFLLR